MEIFINDTATTEIYTLSLHDALPIFRELLLSQHALGGGDGLRLSARPRGDEERRRLPPARGGREGGHGDLGARGRSRSEEHTSELQSRQYLVCRLLLEKK